MTTSSSGERLALVTGASGWLGSQLVPALVGRGWQVRATGRRAEPPRWAVPVEYRSVDLVEDPLDELCAGVSHVFHLAGASSTRYSVEQMARVNRVGGERLARSALEAGVERMVAVSTTAVYGEKVALPSPVVEDAEPSPSRDYGVTKLAAERAIAAVAQDGLEVAVVRPVTVYGPGNTKLIASAMLDVALERAAGLDTLLVGADAVGLRMVHLDDVVDALVHLATVPGAAGRTFNLTSGIYPDSHQVAGALAEVFGMGLDVAGEWDGVLAPEQRRQELAAIAAVAPRSGSIVFTPERLRFLRRPNVNNVLSIDALASVGFRPSRSDLVPALADTLAWYRREGWLPA
ncbi:MAG: NAD(P)-dependent oxidoreductase [Actinomycetota bacterium]|nr:NAD(P)-dependent oxidoreductase [Actinomycetota bacterium]